MQPVTQPNLTYAQHLRAYTCAAFAVMLFLYYLQCLSPDTVHKIGHTLRKVTTSSSCNLLTKSHLVKVKIQYAKPEQTTLTFTAPSLFCSGCLPSTYIAVVHGEQSASLKHLTITRQPN